MKTRFAIGVVTAVAAVSTVGALAIHADKTNADFDLPGLNQQVQNHEARITNTEGDVKALQDNTKTQPSVVRVEVPVVTAQPVDNKPAPTPTVPTVVAVSTKQYTCYNENGASWAATVTHYSDNTDKMTRDSDGRSITNCPGQPGNGSSITVSN